MSALPRRPLVHGRDELVASVRERLGGGRIVALTPAYDESGMGCTTVARRVAMVARERWTWSRPLDGPWPHRALRRALETAGRPVPAEASLPGLVSAVREAWRDRPPELLVLDGIGRADAAAAAAILAARPADVPVLLTVDRAHVADDLAAEAVIVGPIDDRSLDRWLQEARLASQPMTRVWRTLAGGRPLVWSILSGGRLPMPPDDIVLDGPPALTAAFVARAQTLGRSARRLLRALSVPARAGVDVARADALSGIDASPQLDRLEQAGLLVRAPTAAIWTLPRGVAALAAQEAMLEGLVRVVRDRQRSWVSDPAIAASLGYVDAVEVLRRLKSVGQRAAWQALCDRIGDSVGAFVPEALDPHSDALGDADGEPTRVMRRAQLGLGLDDGEVELGEIELEDDLSLDLRDDEEASTPSIAPPMLPDNETGELGVFDVDGYDVAVDPVTDEHPWRIDEEPTGSFQRPGEASSPEVGRLAADDDAFELEPTVSERRPAAPSPAASPGQDDEVALDDDLALDDDVAPADQVATKVMRRPVFDADPPSDDRTVGSASAGVASDPPPDGEPTRSIRRRDAHPHEDASPVVQWLPKVHRARALRERLDRIDRRAGASVRPVLDAAIRRDPNAVDAATVKALGVALEEAEAAIEAAAEAQRSAWAAEARDALARLGDPLPDLPEPPAMVEALDVWEGVRTARRDAAAAGAVAERAWRGVAGATSWEAARSQVGSARAATAASEDASHRLRAAFDDLASFAERMRDRARERFQAALDEGAAVLVAASADLAAVREDADPAVHDVLDDALAEAEAARSVLERQLAEAPAAPVHGATLDAWRRAAELAEAHVDDLAHAAEGVRQACEAARDRLEAEAARREEARAARCAEAVRTAQAASLQAQEAASETGAASDAAAVQRVAMRMLQAAAEAETAAGRVAGVRDPARAEALAAEAVRQARAVSAARKALDAYAEGELGEAEDRRALRALTASRDLDAAGTPAALRAVGEQADALMEGLSGAEAEALRGAWRALSTIPDGAGPTTRAASTAVIRAMLAEVVLFGAGPPVA